MSEKRRTMIYRFVLSSAVLAFLVTFVAIVYNIYIRWYVNQTFSFFGGFDALALGIILLGQTLALACIYHAETK